MLKATSQRRKTPKGGASTRVNTRFGPAANTRSRTRKPGANPLEPGIPNNNNNSMSKSKGGRRGEKTRASKKPPANVLSKPAQGALEVQHYNAHDAGPSDPDPCAVFGVGLARFNDLATGSANNVENPAVYGEQLLDDAVFRAVAVVTKAISERGEEGVHFSDLEHNARVRINAALNLRRANEPNAPSLNGLLQGLEQLGETPNLTNHTADSLLQTRRAFEDSPRTTTAGPTGPSSAPNNNNDTANVPQISPLDPLIIEQIALAEGAESVRRLTAEQNGLTSESPEAPSSPSGAGSTALPATAQTFDDLSADGSRSPDSQVPERSSTPDGIPGIESGADDDDDDALQPEVGDAVLEQHGRRGAGRREAGEQEEEADNLFGDNDNDSLFGDEPSDVVPVVSPPPPPPPPPPHALSLPPTPAARTTTFPDAGPT